MKAIITDTINSYPISHTSCFYFRFDSLPLYWSGMCKDMQLHVYHKLQCDSLTEGGYIEISYDSGLTFHNIVDDDDLFGNALNYNQTLSDFFYSKQDTLNNGIPSFTGNWTGWKKSSYYWYGLMPVKSIQNLALIRFCFQSDSLENNKNGWMIDDVQLRLTGYFPFNCTSVENYSKK